jgi:hypothetical protein
MKAISGSDNAMFKLLLIDVKITNPIHFSIGVYPKHHLMQVLICNGDSDRYVRHYISPLHPSITHSQNITFTSLYNTLQLH